MAFEYLLPAEFVADTTCFVFCLKQNVVLARKPLRRLFCNCLQIVCAGGKQKSQTREHDARGIQPHNDYFDDLV